MGSTVIDYFDGAEADLLKRGQTLLSKIPPRLPREFQLLTQKCRDELTNDLDAVRGLKKLPPEARLRKFKRIVAHIDMLEVSGFAALNRANDDDKHLNILIERIGHEINYPSLPPVVTLLSQSYYYISSILGLLSVPLGEADSLLHIPDLYHELAHPLVGQRYEPRVQPFRLGLVHGLTAVENYIAAELAREDRSRGPLALRHYLTNWMKSWTESWLEELFCDLFATYTLGPAFVWSHLHLCVKRGMNPFATPLYVPTSHPADDARMTVMLQGLRRIGFSADAERIAARWQEFLKIGNYRPEPEFHRCYTQQLLDVLSQLAYESVDSMGCRIARPTTTDIVHDALNSAWTQFWQAPARYPQWETTAVARLRSQLAQS